MTRYTHSPILRATMAKNFGIGNKAPVFTLKDQNGQIISLEEALSTGPVALFFYPGDQTPGCTIQLCAIRDDWNDFIKAGIHVYGINPADAKSHTAFIKKHDFPFPLLIDENRKVTKAYDAEQDLFITKIVKRTVVGIAKDGHIIYYRQGMPKNTEIIKAFK